MRILPVSQEGPPWWFYAALVGGIVLSALMFLLHLALQRRRKERRCRQCGRILLSAWTRCLFCGASLGAPDGPGLQFVSGPLLGQTVRLESEVTTIGSVEGNVIQLADCSVSRKHAGIRRLDGAFELADLGSAQGIYVNGEKVARRQLASGDVIRVGTSEMIFRN